LRDAVEVMAAHYGVTLSPDELERLSAVLPARARRTREHETVLRRLPSPDPSPEELAMASDRQADAERLLAALDRAVEALDPPDRLALTMRFQEGRTVAEIARITGTEPRRLYTRMTRLVSEIRTTLEADGFDRAAVRDLLGRLDVPGPAVTGSRRRPALRPSMAKGL